jgi:hypothetical protein
MIFINVRQLIKRIIREETEIDLSSKIEKLLIDSVVSNHEMICKINVVAPGKLIGNTNAKHYQVMVSVIGGLGTINWPMTQFVHASRDKIVDDVWRTIYDYMGLVTDVFLRNVKSCDEVMSESTIPNTVKRRANTKTLQDYITNGEINYPMLCDDFEDGYEYADNVIDYAIDNFINEFDENLFDYNEDYYSNVMDYLRTLCRDEFGQELIDIYNTTCIENVKEEQNESEITERCWKGYTQKGMKTMFGKRYPNCVKIKKKKKMNESKMMDYLQQFLSGEVLDNYKKEKGRKEFQKLVDIVYKITSKDNPIEGMVGVLVGNIDKDMWGRNFNDDKSVGLRWDFKVILKPLFTNFNPNDDPEYNERVLNFQKEFIQNARGMGFEAISPIQHPKIKNYRVSFEWASRLDVKEI